MKLKTKNFVDQVGRRLEFFRKSHGLIRSDMAKKLSLSWSNLYRNEIGVSFPSLETLLRLHMDFDISLDWLLFNEGLMNSKEKQDLMVMEKQALNLENKLPDVKQLLTTMTQDHVFFHEVMLCLYKYLQGMPSETLAPVKKSGCLPAPN